MNILLTGATGFLGSHLLEALLDRGFQVIILKRSFSDTWRIREYLDQVDSFDIDKTSIEEPFRKYGRIDIIIHTATKYGKKGEKVSEVVEANLYFPLRLLEIATFFNTATILYKHLNSYSLSKKQFVEWLKQFSDRIRIVNLKLEHMYGPKDDSSKFVQFVIESLLRNEEKRTDKREQKRDFIFIKDVVEAYLKLLEAYDSLEDGFNEFEVGAGESITIKELVVKIKMLTGNTKTKLIFGALPYRENEIMESKADITKLKGIGWSPKVSLEDGLKDTINWCRQNV